jgi:hypothetical protein
MSNLFTALLAVQKAAPTLPKDKTATVPMKNGGKYTYKYTDLATIVEKVGPSLADNGLVWTSFPSNRDGTPVLRYALTHAESGESIEDTMPLLLGGKLDSQGLGSAVTYARRYALCAVLNLVADEDDDGRVTVHVGEQRSAQTNGADTFTQPTDKQLSFLKSLITKSGAPPRTLRAMLDSVQASDVEIAAGWTAKLNREQVSRLIELFKAGSLPDPAAVDVQSPPNDFAGVAPAVGDDGELPWEPSE